jgi:hypothetical protein
MFHSAAAGGALQAHSGARREGTVAIGRLAAELLICGAGTWRGPGAAAVAWDGRAPRRCFPFAFLPILAGPALEAAVRGARESVLTRPRCF